MPRPRPIPPARWARIRLFAMDVDGILTDGTVMIASDGVESKRFFIRDGLGLAWLRDRGLALAWISGRASEATARRAAELRIPHLIQGRHDKLEALSELAVRLGLELDQCVYMGDDLIDAPALRAAGIGVSVPDGTEEAIAAADWITRNPGGQGAVREVCDRLLRAGAPPRPSAARKARP